MAEKTTKKVTAEEKTKTCFVIMPISDVDGYEAGHFKRVYEHIIKPACEIAGFKPFRADDVNTTNHIIIDILKRIIEADMTICDLSSRNPNVLYELGIRQAFNLPVTLIKDERTSRIFDIQTLRDVPYNSSLRIDTIEQVVPMMADALKSTYENKDDSINSIIQLLGIEAAKVTKTEVSEDTGLLLNAINNLGKRISKIEDRSNFREPESTGISYNFSVILNEEIETEEISKAEKIIQDMFQSSLRSLRLSATDEGYRLQATLNRGISARAAKAVVAEMENSNLKIFKWDFGLS